MSIRYRLALWYGGIFGVILLVFSILLYAFMVRHLEGMAEEAATSRAAHLLSTFEAANADSPPGVLRIPPLDTFETPEVYVQVLAADGSILERSSNLTGTALPAADLPPAGGATVVRADGMLLKQTIQPILIDDRIAGWVQVAASYGQRDLILARLRRALIIGGATAVAAVAVSGGALAGRALRPVSEMIETARAIALSRGFSRRLQSRNPNDELGQLAAAFNEMLSSLEAAYSAQQRFTADASHELRAPLTSIRGNLDLLHRVPAMPEEERAATLAQVRREVERLARLVNDLLALARADAGQSLRLEPVELDALLVDVHRQSLTMANGVDVKIDHLVPAVVEGDADRLRELLLILADNAIKYTPEGGVVSFRLDIGRESSWATVAIEDTGIGIAPDDLPHVFDRFWRADAARSRDRGGTGLGLAIAKWIIDHHGGEITVDSQPGKGTRFAVRLPTVAYEGYPGPRS